MEHGEGSSRAEASGDPMRTDEALRTDEAPRTNPASSAAVSDDEYLDEPEPEEGQNPSDEQDMETGSGRGAWQGSRVTPQEIEWLRKSRRIPDGVSVGFLAMSWRR